MNRKQKRLLLLLLGLLALLLLLYLGLKALNKRPAQEEDEPQTLTRELGTITELSYSGAAGTLHFIQQDGCWVWSEDDTYPLDSSRVQELADVLSQLTAIRSIEPGQQDSLQAYGLTEPSASVTARDDAGVSVTLSLGGSTGGSDYLQRSGDENVYVVSSTLRSHLDMGISELFLLDGIPALTENNLLSLQVEGAETILLTAQLTEVSKEDGSESTEFAWLSDGEDVTENAALEGLLEELETLAFTSNMDYSGSTEAASYYGLDHPLLSLTVSYQDQEGASRSFTLAVGRQQSDGSYTAKLGNSKQINLLSGESIRCILLLAQNGLS